MAAPISPQQLLQLIHEYAGTHNLPKTMDKIKELIGAGSGNATVPDGAKVWPPQAFVDTVTQMVDFNSIDFHLAGKSITHFDSDLLKFKYYSQGLGLADLSNNALDSTEVEALLDGLVNMGAGSSVTVNLSGGTNAAPVSTEVHQDGQAQFSLFDGPGNPGGYQVLLALTFPVSSPFRTLNIFEQGAYTFDQSSDDFPDIRILSGDNPTAAQKAAYLQEHILLSAPDVSFSYDDSSKVVTLTFSNDNYYPIGGQGMTIEGTQGGSSKVNTLRGNGATVITN